MDINTQAELTRLQDEVASSSKAGHFDQAEKKYRQIIDIMHQHKGAEATYRDLYNISSVLVSQQKYDEAAPILTDLLLSLSQRSIDCDDNSNLLEQETGTVRLLIQTFRGQGRSEEADELMAGSTCQGSEE